MDQTFFYIVGGALVALALIISMIGLRSEDFPSSRILAAGVGLMAAVVVVTATAAVSSSGGEQDVNAEASANAASQAASNMGAAGGSASGSSAQPATPSSGQGDNTAPSGGGASAADGATVFASNGCGGCHTLTAASSTGAVGPNLDEALVNKDPAFIKTSIIDPAAEIEKGFPANVMPSDFGTRISPGDLDALVAYLAQSTSGK